MIKKLNNIFKNDDNFNLEDLFIICENKSKIFKIDSELELPIIKYSSEISEFLYEYFAEILFNGFCDKDKVVCNSIDACLIDSLKNINFHNEKYDFPEDIKNLIINKKYLQSN